MESNHKDAPQSVSMSFHCKTYPLPKGFIVRFSLDIDKGEARCVWSPDIPKSKQLRKIWPEYLAAQNDFFSRCGISILALAL